MAGGLAASSRRSGRGRRSARKSRLSEINVTPFVDVMLVLLTVGVPIELPQTEAKQLESEADPLTISIRADGAIFVQETVVAKEALVAQMRAISQEGYDRRVFIRADATADYGLVADVMARLSSSGFRNLGLVTDTIDGPRRTPSSAEEREEE
jgi:biopolymer transport protein TolR